MLMKNAKDKPVRMKSAVLVNPPKDKDGKVPVYVAVEPGAEVECRDGYCHPMIAANGSRTPSIIEKTAPGMEPADPKVKEEWLKVPEKNWQPPKQELSAKQLQAMGVAPKVAQLQAKKAEAEAKAKEAMKAKVKEVTTPKEEPEATEPAPADEEKTDPGVPAAKEKAKKGRGKK